MKRILPVLLAGYVSPRFKLYNLVYEYIYSS